MTIKSAQQRLGVPADGQWGPKTDAAFNAALDELERLRVPEVPPEEFAVSEAAFFSAVRANPFGGRLSQPAVDGLDALLQAWGLYGDRSQRHLAYVLGTAFHESDRFRTMEEYASGAAYEGRASLGNTHLGDGKRFKGRGFVQITGRRNYVDWGNRLGLDLVSQPELAADRTIAARIAVEGMLLGTFTGKKLADYSDFVQMRRVVNGTDKASMIATYAEAFLKALP